jgi:hypothetical protein
VIGHADRAGPLRDYCVGLMMPGERKSVEPMAALQLLDRRWRHEAGPDQAMRQQIGEPSRVVHITLAAGHVLDMHGIRQDQCVSRAW